MATTKAPKPPKPRPRTLGPYLERTAIPRAVIKSATRTAVRLHATPKDDVAVGRSKVGGLPDLPAGLAWPTTRYPLPRKRPIIARYTPGEPPMPEDGVVPLTFLAQIALDTLPAFPDRALLPKRGLLSFFYDATAWAAAGKKKGWDYLFFRHPARTRVLYTDHGVKLARAARAPGTTYPTHALEAWTEPTLPSYESSAFDALRLSARARTAWTEADYELDANVELHLLLGWAAQLQPYALESSYKEAHAILYPKERALPKKPTARTYEKCRLLLQLDEIGPMRFGRGGRLYFFIREDDLTAGDFSRVWSCEQ